MCYQPIQVDSTKVKVLMSFGAQAGGFEFAWELRNQIVRKRLGIGSVYLDALSLKADSATTYNWDPILGIYKMQNPNWATFYEKAMDSCTYVIFLISKPWLSSYYCWYEYEMFLDKSTKRAITPIFIIFDEGDNMLTFSNSIKVKNPNDQQVDKSIKDLELYIRQKEKTVHIKPTPAPGNVIVDGASYQYSYKYACTNADTKSILAFLH